MSRRLPPLNAIRVFEAAARHRSFVRAAEELHVTPAAVSQQIKSLEQYLGTELFSRGKKLALNDAADAVLPLVSDALDEIERAMFKLRPGRVGDTLVISAPPTFAARWLIPRLEDFQARYPDIELRLDATRRTVDFDVEDVDVAIRFGAGRYPGLTADRLMEESIMPVAAPSLAKGIVSAEDLARCTLLQDDWHIENGMFPDWPTWLATLGVESPEPLRIRHFSDASLVIQGVASGLGVALSWYSLVVDDLKAGRLVRLLDQLLPTTLGYYLVMPEGRVTARKIDVFRSWLLDQASRQQPA